jgi:hypothetical protein
MSITGTAEFRAKVRVWLDASAMGQRPGWKTGQRPHHRIEGRGNEYFIGQLDFLHGAWLRPGECVEAIGSFIVMARDLPSFVPGFRWELVEGGAVVGHAEYLEFIEHVGA